MCICQPQPLSCAPAMKNDKSWDWILLCVEFKWISVWKMCRHTQLLTSNSDFSQLISRAPFYLGGKQVVVSHSTYDETDSPSMCFLSGMRHLPTCSLRFGRDTADISGDATTTHSCSAVWDHSTARAMCHFDFIPWRDCCRTDIHVDLRTITKFWFLWE